MGMLVLNTIGDLGRLIANLCFADDLIIFCNGDMHSVSLIKEPLEEFKFLSGISPSLEQSHVFFSGVDENVRRDILGVLGL